MIAAILAALSRARRVRFVVTVALALALLAAPSAQAQRTVNGRELQSEGAKDLFKEGLFEALDKAGEKTGGVWLEVGGVERRLLVGKVFGAVDDVLLDPVLDAITTEGTYVDKFYAFAKGAVAGGVKVAWPGYGLSVEAGKVFIGGSIVTVEQMIAAANAQQVDSMIFGPSVERPLGSYGNLYSSASFFATPKLSREGLSATNLGEKLKTEDDLRNAWFRDYRFALTGQLPLNKAEVDAQLAAGFPRLLEVWRLQRAAIVAEEFARELERGALRAQREAEQIEVAGRMAEDADVELDGSADEGGEDEGFGDEDDEEITIEISEEDLDAAFPDLDDANDDGSRIGDGAREVDDGTIGDATGVGGELVAGQQDAGPPLTGTVYDLVETKPDTAFEGWSVADGHVELTGYGYKGTYDWSTPPATIGAGGFTITLNATVQTDKGQRLASGLKATGGFTFTPAADIAVNADTDSSATGAVSSQVVPPQGVATGSEAELRVGVYWGLGVTYRYRAR